MVVKLKENQRLVCVGQTALRAPDGTPLPAKPMYIITDDDTAGNAEDLTISESGLYDDLAAVLGSKFKQYADGLQAAGMEL